MSQKLTVSRPLLSHKLLWHFTPYCRNGHYPTYDVTDRRMLSHSILGVTYHVQEHASSIELRTAHDQTLCSPCETYVNSFRKTYVDTPCHKIRYTSYKRNASILWGSEGLYIFLAKSVQTHERLRNTSRVHVHTARSARKCRHTSVRPSFPKFRSQERISVVSHQKMPQLFRDRHFAIARSET